MKTMNIRLQFDYMKRVLIKINQSLYMLIKIKMPFKKANYIEVYVLFLYFTI